MKIQDNDQRRPIKVQSSAQIKLLKRNLQYVNCPELYAVILERIVRLERGEQ